MSIRRSGNAALKRRMGSTRFLENFKDGVSRSWPLYLMILPAFVAFAIFQYLPMYGLQIAFKDFRPSLGFSGSPWVGLKHFERFLSYPDCWRMVRNTLRITLYSLATFPCPVIFALLINELRHTGYKKTVQMVTYMPHFLSDVVVCSLVLLLLDRATGPINNMIVALGGKRQQFMGNPKAFSSIYVWSGVWQNLGWSSILYVSALSSISPELIEAARMDGAGRFGVIWHVNLPGILPVIIISFILNSGNLLSVGFSKIYLLQNDLNLSASNVISTYTYQIGLISQQYSYSSAIGLLNTVVNIVVLLLVNTGLKKISGTGMF